MLVFNQCECLHKFTRDPTSEHLSNLTVQRGRTTGSYRNHLTIVSKKAVLRGNIAVFDAKNEGDVGYAMCDKTVHGRSDLQLFGVAPTLLII